MSQPPLLPPIQGQDYAPQVTTCQAPQQPQYAPPASMNGAPQVQSHPSLLPPTTYNYHDNLQQPPQTQQQQPISPYGAINGQSQARYPLPPHQMDARQMSGGRQKKEIKRRTKTGCLTCRKRRIKCDEAHPTCKNCQKSKRDCLGYDPIFKSQGAPAPILPAAGATPPIPRAPSHSSPSVPPQPAAFPPPHTSQGPPPPPQGYAPAVSAGYAPPAPPAPHPIENDYNYGAALDPALAVVPPPPPPTELKQYSTTLLPNRSMKHLIIDDLFLGDDVPPSVFPPTDYDTPFSDSDVVEMRNMFRQQYATGLDSFFETQWYITYGEICLLSNRPIAHFLKYCVDRFKTPPQHQEEFQLFESLEARLIWLLATIPQHADLSTIADDQNIDQLLKRISIMAHLLTGQFLPKSDMPHKPLLPKNYILDNPHDIQNFFWHHLATFTSIDDSTTSPLSSSDSLAAIVQSLSNMRGILNMLENRDVLYSIAIARHYGGRAAEYRPDEVLVPNSQDPEDPFSKLNVAMRFLASEESAGTTQVVQRMCGMSRRSWWRSRPDVDATHANAQGQGAVNASAEPDPEPELQNGHIEAPTFAEPTPPAAQVEEQPKHDLEINVTDSRPTEHDLLVDVRDDHPLIPTVANGEHLDQPRSALDHQHHEQQHHPLEEATTSVTLPPTSLPALAELLNSA